MYTKPLKELTQFDTNTAGGKGASLGEMIQNGLPVPDGFVVLASTFDAFLAETDVLQEIESILSTVDTNAIHTVESAAERIQFLITNKPFPVEIAKEILDAHEVLRSTYVAVRSSATAEDGAEHAWAGQLSTFLNIDAPGVLTAVQACWASLYTPRAIFYRFEKLLDKTPVSVAVVIQKMIQSEKSGVAFSVHPITEDYNQIIIEAGYGLGEAIVSGEVTPDSYVIRKDNRITIDSNINVQTKALYQSATSHDGEFTEWRLIPEPLASSQALTSGEINELTDIIVKIENHYRFPCDIEWAFAEGRFFVTQSRPITTLGKRSSVPKSETWEKIWEAGNAPIFEMTHGTVLAHDHQMGLGLVDTEMAVVGSREKIAAHYTTESLKQSALDGHQFYLRKSNQFLAEANALLMEAHGMIGRVERLLATVEVFSDTSQLLRKSFAYFNVTNPQFTAGLEAEVRSDLQTYVADALDEVMGDLCVSSKVNLLQQEHIDWLTLMCKAQTASTQIVNDLLQHHYNTYKYLVGDEGNAEVTVEVLQRRLQRALSDGDDFEAELNHLKRFTETTEAKKKQHIAKYKLPESLIAKCDTLAHVGHIRLELRSAWTATFHVLRRQLKVLAELNGFTYDALTEHTADDIVRILKGELALESKPSEFSVVLKNGKWEIQHGLESVNISKHITARADYGADSFKGSVAFPGVVTGTVVLIIWGAADMDEKITNFPSGGILVAGQTRPMLIPAIKRAAAIVTDEGGITSHAAIVAREFQKPSVIGTKIATEVLKDGDIVEVDATRGVITILEKQTSTTVNPDHYIRMFAWKSFSYLLSDLFQSYYKPLGVVSIHDDVSWLSLFPKNMLNATLAEGEAIYTNSVSYESYRSAFEEYINSSAKTFDDTLSKPSLTADEVRNLFTIIEQSFTFYSKTEFFYTDSLVKSKLAISVADFDALKLKGRAYLNKLILEEDGYLKSLLHKVSRQSNISVSILSCCSVTELVTLIKSGEIISDHEIEARKKYYFVSKDGTYSGDAAKQLVEPLFKFYRGVASVIRGSIANTGKATGVARVLVPDTKDFNLIGREVEAMQLGEILIAETTSPEIIQACKKAAAIVANQGGMLSHAAIISRELNIPCIIGTDKDVILSIKTGDIVEVDATQGIVRVIK